jgi:hypothetical protein
MHVPCFHIRQKITLMVNRYEVLEANPDSSEGSILAFAQQKRMTFKEHVIFYALVRAWAGGGRQGTPTRHRDSAASMGLYPLPRRHLDTVRLPF